MIVQGMPVGAFQANCYIVGCEDTGTGAVIDPGDEVDRILRLIEEFRLTPRLILNTHGHLDHVAGNAALKKATSAQLVAHRGDAPMLENLSLIARSWGMRAEDSPHPDRFVDEGDVVTVGSVSLKVLHTPGHSPGSISLYADGMVFVGDLLFAGSIGRTDFPGGDHATLIRSVRTKIFTLGDDTTVLPGHGPATTVGMEKRANPFFQ
jgi:hydroxyacylglutathione hydrolase